MKSLLLIILTTVMAASSATRTYAQGTLAPLSLFINGSGTVSPLTNGELLEVGQPYNMVAIPDAGFAFNSWQPVNVFTQTDFVVDSNGNTNAVVSVIASPAPTYTNHPSLSFIMHPVVVIYNNPGVSTITESSAWQANFGPVLLNIQRSVSTVILTWTNSAYTLQAAPAPGAVYSNIPGAVSPYTNTISGPAQYFRLFSN